MEAHGNEYVQQLLDRAANLVTTVVESEPEGEESEASQWLAEYHAEKARFGQPEGSPAYAETRGAADDGAEQGSETGTKRRAAPRAKK